MARRNGMVNIMKGFLTVYLKNFTKRKIYTATIITLTLLTTLALVISIGIIFKLETTFKNSYQSSGEAQLIFGFDKSTYKESYIDFFTDKASVDKVTEVHGLLGSIAFEENDTITTLLSVYDGIEATYLFDDFQSHESLSNDEVYLPLYFKNEYNYQSNDEIYVLGHRLIIKGFFEDPIYGSPLYHTKRLFVNQNTYEYFLENYYSQLRVLTFLNIFLTIEAKSNTNSVVTDLKNEFDVNSIYVFDENSVASLRTTVPSIVLSILIIIAVLLLSIMILIMRYSVLSSIEDDFLNIGIMKAIGFSNRNIRLIQLSQYFTLVFIGGFAGIYLSFFLSPSIGQYLFSISGMLWQEGIDFFVYLFVFLALNIIVLGFVYLQIRKVNKITPVKAITKGRSENSKNNKLTNINGIFLSCFPISLRMAVKQILTKPAQYITVFFMTIIFSFMITTVTGLQNNFASDEQICAILGYDLIDVRLNVINKASGVNMNQILDDIDEKYNATYTSVYETNYKGYVDKDKVQLLVYSNLPETNIIKGRSAVTYNEVVVSSGISKSLDIDVGDEINISLSNDKKKEKTFIVVGINNQVYGLGKNISITVSGLEHLLEDEYIPHQYLLKLDQDGSFDDIVNEIKNVILDNQEGVSVTNEHEIIMNRIKSMQSVFLLITSVVAIVSFILIALITSLVALVVVKRETKGLGIMKSLGFTSKQIRFQFTGRFVIISAVGALIGAITTILSSNGLVNMVFGYVGLAKIPSGITIKNFIISIVFIIASSALFSWLVSYNIKKVSTKELLV